jgi:hypothetical protein
MPMMRAVKWSSSYHNDDYMMTGMVALHKVEPWVGTLDRRE